MDNYELDSWVEFGPLIKKIKDQYGAVSRELPDGRRYERNNQILFRGQSNSQWELETTLGRKTSIRYDVLRYLDAVLHCINEIESFTGKQWEARRFPEIRQEILENQDSGRVILPCYDYLAYLRHHGFPSPLLDWTESPYIAAYFAYCEQTITDRVAVYAFIETPDGMKGRQGDGPQITVKGPYTTTHTRHFAQKAWYTIATEWKDNCHFFCPHEEVFRGGFPFAEVRQDVLVKITLPSAERGQVLRELNEYNITHFTLFQSEDALVKTMGMKLFDMNESGVT